MEGRRTERVQRKEGGIRKQNGCRGKLNNKSQEAGEKEEVEVVEEIRKENKRYDERGRERKN